MQILTSSCGSLYQQASFQISQSAAWIKAKYSAALDVFSSISFRSNHSINKFIDEHYIVSLKSSKTIEGAQVICLAETHDREDVRLQNAKIIDALYRPGDIVLVEQLSDVPIVQPFGMTKYVTTPINVKGWDCKLDDVPGIPWFLTALDSNVSRHNNMHQVIQESLSQHKRVFLIAGRFHLYEKDPLFKSVDVVPSMLQAVTNTMEFLKQKRSIVLIPKATLDHISTKHSYSSDLSNQEKLSVQVTFIDHNTVNIDFNTLNIVFRQYPKLSVTIRRQDIFASGAQVIVNSSNVQLSRGDKGIDAAIHAKGGKGYAEAHMELQRKFRGLYASGNATMIDSGSLKETHNIDHVIVVAGPEGPSNPQTDSQLYSCYYNSLVVAQAQDKSSIAFPSISTGVLGFPRDRAAAISLKAIHDFIQDYPDTHLKKISIHFQPGEPIAFLWDYQKEVAL